jgi:hypothetical protein
MLLIQGGAPKLTLCDARRITLYPVGWNPYQNPSCILRGQKRGSKVGWDPSSARPHSWHGHCGSARAFAVNPARLEARPLRPRGIDGSARPSKGLFMPTIERCASREGGKTVAACRLARWFVAWPKKTVDSAALI